ncbi:glycosyltransferase family 4 protein [Jannaschia sp. 2305UL9-9]|uniref:glycosyltransferase family 4 protein n=1 Tax=Jannaschia sp. 2305UL9-9 TaxID=3121638 RepID=UPI0035280615
MADRPAPQAMRIVIINDAGVARGGATGLALLSARLLRANGYAVTYICGDGGDDGALEAEGVEVIPLGGASLRSRGRLKVMRQGLYDQGVLDRVSRIIAETDTPRTVYHLHGWAQILSPSVIDALAPVAARTFIHAHDFFLACPNGAYFDFGSGTPCARTPLSAACLATACDKRSFAQKAWRAARQVRVRRVLGGGRNWAGILQLHEGMTDGLVRGGVPAQLLRTVRNPATALLSERIEAERNQRFVFLGRTEPGKGVGRLCKAARAAGVPLRIVGSVDERPDLVRDYPEVDFTGWVGKADMARVLRDCRALVMPSRFTEPFGLVAPEASLSGLPVAISSVALLARDISDAGLGVSIDVGSTDALAADLRRFAARPNDEIRAMSMAGFSGRNSVAQTPDAWIDQLLGLYHAALVSAE